MFSRTDVMTNCRRRLGNSQIAQNQPRSRPQPHPQETVFWTARQITTDLLRIEHNDRRHILQQQRKAQEFRQQYTISTSTEPTSTTSNASISVAPTSSTAPASANPTASTSRTASSSSRSTHAASSSNAATTAPTTSTAHSRRPTYGILRYVKYFLA